MAQGALRVIAGKWKGSRLARPSESTTRPMTDRVRESVFNILGSHWGEPGRLPPLRVADLFAGSGSLGFEALSRGVASCDFFEGHGAAAAVLRGNLIRLRAGAEARLVAVNVWRWTPSPGAHGPYGLVFLDPPFRDSRDLTRKSPVGGLLRKLARVTEEDAILVFHHERSQRCPADAHALWREEDRREFGSHAVTFLHRTTKP